MFQVKNSNNKEALEQSYPAKHYQHSNENIAVCHAIINDNPLASLVFIDDDNSLQISHIPCHFANKNLNSLNKKEEDTEEKHEQKEADKTTLIAHISNQHPLATKLQNGAQVSITLLFHGEDAYISPNDVSESNRQAQMVPTWNYSNVHVEGQAKEITNIEDKYQQMVLTTAVFEQNRETPWTLESANNKAISHMLKAITIFEVSINKLEARFKLSQNKSVVVKTQLADNLTLRGKAELAQQMLAIN